MTLDFLVKLLREVVKLKGLKFRIEVFVAMLKKKKAGTFI